MNQKQLASKVNIKVELLQKYEKGLAIIEPRILHKIKKTLNMI
jgi:ribosome-binding protein aMBF1 (putative translation factor)